MEVLNEFGKTAAQYARDHKKQVQQMIRAAIERNRAERAARVELLHVEPTREVFQTPHGSAYAVEKYLFTSIGSGLDIRRKTTRITLPWCSIQGR